MWKRIILQLFLIVLLGVDYCAGQNDSLQKKHHLLVLPVVARSIETSWSFGGVSSYTFRIKKEDTISRTSNLQALVLYTLRKQLIIALNGVLYFPGEKFILSYQMSYSDFPDKFWGLGKTTPSTNEEPYKFRQGYLYLHAQRSLGQHFFFGALYEYQRLINIEYRQGGLFDQENVRGRYNYHVSGLGLSLTYDTRTNAFAPLKGSMLQISFNHFDPLLGSQFKYTNYVVDLRKYIHTYKEQVLALQAFGFFNGGDVPLRSLAAFGGANSMRGYYSGRFRDKNQLVFQAEYRAPLFWRLGAVAFGGVGDVSRKISDFNFNSVKYSYGGGLRVALNKRERLNLRIDYGIGKGPARGFYFQLAEAF